MKKLAIIGASGHGKVVADCAELCGWDEVVFYDDVWPENKFNSHWAIIGDTSELIKNNNHYDGVIVAIGDNRIRQAKLKLMESESIPLVSIVHPDSIVSRYSEVGVGSVILAGAVINTDVVIGVGAIINTAATVDHDCSLGDCVHISPGANLAGGVNIGSLSWVGVSASVIPGITVSENVIIGAGAAVIENVDTGLTVVGVPAKNKGTV